MVNGARGRAGRPTGARIVRLGGRSQHEAIERAEDALAQAVDALAEHGRPLPEPTPVEAIALPKGCDLVAYFMVGVDPPDPSERVNVYLPKSLLARADRHASELGMSRSSFFGLAVSSALATIPRFAITGLEGWVEPRSKVHRAGSVRAGKSARKPQR